VDEYRWYYLTRTIVVGVVDGSFDEFCWCRAIVTNPDRERTLPELSFLLLGTMDFDIGQPPPFDRTPLKPFVFRFHNFASLTESGMNT